MVITMIIIISEPPYQPPHQSTGVVHEVVDGVVHEVVDGVVHEVVD